MWHWGLCTVQSSSDSSETKKDFGISGHYRASRTLEKKYGEASMFVFSKNLLNLLKNWQILLIFPILSFALRKKGLEKFGQAWENFQIENPDSVKAYWTVWNFYSKPFRIFKEKYSCLINFFLKKNSKYFFESAMKNKALHFNKPWGSSF